MTCNPSRQTIGLLLQNWHASGSDPVYQAGSHYLVNEPVDRSTAQAALYVLAGIYRDRKLLGLTRKDVRELNKIGRFLLREIQA